MVVKEKKKATSRYRGVHLKRTFGRLSWCAQVTVKNQTIYLGSYDDEIGAAKAYDMYVIRMGLNRQTNFFKKKLA